ncbi:MAG: hypothetical protein FD176_2235 [Rhodospirillaceae bacterium]|nr:MAG: hypothetical protein FD176_2235 [Rhodospirillaceae bacterium]TNC95808.1 MAG: hypothetical protein FD119_2183 [Stygiobacter sp.]
MKTMKELSIRAAAYVVSLMTLLGLAVFMMSFIFTTALAIQIERGELEAISDLQEGMKSPAGLAVIAILGVIVLVAADFRARQIATWLTRKVFGHHPKKEG